MLRHSPSRNQRSKGVKIKHVLQICLLLAVCFWLIYQVKHSHDKRKEFDEHEHGVKILENAKSSGEILKLGRKDLHPREEEKVINSEKNEEEEIEEEETGGGGEEENKHEVEEQEHEVGSKNEEKEDEERGVGDDEIDELDQDKTEGDADPEENFIDEEKEREEESEEKDVEGKGLQTDDESSLEDQDQDHDGSGRNTHEAREEHYKADDASSEVAHDTDTINTEMEKRSMENTKEDNVLEQEHKSNDNEKITGQNHSGSMLGEGKTAENINLLNVTAGEGKGNETILLKSEDSSLLNTTTYKEFNDQPELNNNSTKLSTEKTVAAVQKSTETILDSTQAHNVTVQGTIIGEGADNSSSADVGYHSNPKENADTTQNEKSDSSEETGTTDEESSDSSSINENADSLEHDHDGSILQEEKENRIDLDTLPEIRTEGSGNEDTAAE